MLRVAAVVLSFAALALIEVALRLAEYGGDYRLFVESAEDSRFLLPNPDVVERYFPDGMAPALAIEENYFLRDKPPDGVRVFVQGGSSAAGFPFGSGASIAGLLGYRLKQSFPDRTVEVVDTAMSAVTSYVLLDFADEIIAEKPDAVVIYAGHNEYLGIFSVGSIYSGSGSHALTRLNLRLHRLRLYRLVRDLTVRLRLLIDEASVPEGTTLMAAIARTREIALGSDLYLQGIAQFQSNLHDLADKYAAAGIPVFIGTVASNLKDQPPFISAEQAGANDYFAAGKEHERQGDHAAALADYVLARDHDLLRFRAPSAINESIRSLTNDSGAVLVDAEAALAKASPDGLIGNEFMLEHLHPTAEGYFLLADAFYQALADAATPEPFSRYVPAGAAAEELWIFPAERYYARAAVAQLQSDFPFATTPQALALPPVLTAADALGRAWFDNDISWLELAEASREMADGTLRRAIASQRIADAFPFREDLRERAAADWLAAGRPDDAARYRR